MILSLYLTIASRMACHEGWGKSEHRPCGDARSLP